MKKKLIQATGIFFSVMLIFTILSRVSDSVNVIQIQTKNPSNQVITHEVSGTGKVEGSQEVAVFVLENLQVEQALVHQGQTVKKGDTLLKLSRESMEDAARDLEDKIKTLEGQAKDLESQNKVNSQKRASEQAWADNSYDLAVQSGNVSVDNAREELQAAQQRLDEFYREKEAKTSGDDLSGFTDGEEDFTDGETAIAQEDDSTAEAALQSDLRARQEALNEAIAGRNQTLASAGKAVADASAPEASDSSLENVRRDLENARADLEKVTALQNTDGIIVSPTDGVIKNLVVQTGDLTGQTAAAVLYSSDGALRMTGTISKEDMKYVSAGAEVKLTDNNNNDISGTTVENITENKEDNDIRDLSILLSDDSMAIGQSGDFSISKDSGPYSCCVPLSALYSEDGKDYVYVTDTENTVLGTVMTARKLEVTVQDQNQTTAALGEGSLSTDQGVVVQADRELKDGCRVRISENG
ncbi:hypothetical protein LIQ05_16635 [Blautia glucerasea]|uniref:hypothetical protein n=1 Tax=Blautia glucerasea TaxID=536633 RepID=UPI001D030449|nr:hypothetical protein [Blautia glucerasea]MCB5388595.1 hypothetical protein [Blautia glucerasea]MCB5422930.1 hypothetical protein [Blautia luti]